MATNDSPFRRTDYLKSLDSFYVAIESAARTISDFSQKQHFLNSVYERFFRGYSVNVADTHGIIYTPQPIVDFMVSSVADALRDEFGLSLSSPGVNILDPCTGTGNFVVNIMRRIPRRDLQRMYREQLFANEVMLMPYYIAALNLEHAYLELTGKYEPFQGLCFVDTLDIPEKGQPHILAPDNTRRIERERHTDITVIIGNPPYNAGQLNENDNNKNRKYDAVDRRIRHTYAKDSSATNKNALSDAYVKFFRWATDRLGGRDGVVCFVSNNSFVDQLAMDGMRKHLMQDFTRIDHVDLHGNVRRNPKLSGTTHNVVGIQVGVGITVAVRSKREKRLRYHRVPELWRKEEKLAWLSERKIPWQTIHPDANYTWIKLTHPDEFQALTSLADVFRLHSVGVKTNRDEVVYDFDPTVLAERMKRFIEDYNAEVDRYKRSGCGANVDDFVRYDRIKWSRDLKLDLQRHKGAQFDDNKTRRSLYRAFTKRYLFFDSILNEEVYRNHSIFPLSDTDNRVICCTIDTQMPFSALVADVVPSHAPGDRPGQCFPFYSYDADGSNRRENITGEALQQFRLHYRRPLICRSEIFYYIYAILHHPAYRERFAENLRRELPRIPFAPDFDSFAEAGSQLAHLHVEYEQLQPWPLEWVENPAEPFTYKVPDKTKMRLSKDKRSLTVNPSLTLAGIPPETFEYRLGNRSALEWVIDQYRVIEDPRSGFRSDPNRDDDPQYIVRLVGQVVRVSVETARILKFLPPAFA